MVVVADAVLEARRRPGRLDPADETRGDERTERVVDRLERNRADLGPDDVGHVVGGAVWLARHRSQNGQPLGRDLKAALAKEVGRVEGHTPL